MKFKITLEHLNRNCRIYICNNQESADRIYDKIKTTDWSICRLYYGDVCMAISNNMIK